MAANQQGAVRFPGQGGPEIPGSVGVGLYRQGRQLFSKPIACRDPGFGESDPLCAIFIPG